MYQFDEQIVELSRPAERINNRPVRFRMTQADLPGDYDLLRSVLNGDEQALATLYRRRQGSIYRFALQMSGSHSVAEDVTQEVFMVVIRGDLTYDPEKGSITSLMLGIARNYVLRRLRYQQALVSFGEGSEDGHEHGLVARDCPLDDVTRGETIDAVRKAVLSLPTHYREVVVLCELQELSYVEAARVLGCAVGTVRSRLHRARVLLIEKLRPVADEDEGQLATRSARCFA